ncbi:MULTISPECIES: carbohydrate ABC transporter permease [unclassified Paenibacillus]|uniref:carbohydrate ABC transporter permease n=1 Tax=unclassified Paenibacillus TaxID=185978 RepID=UPI002F41AE72
MRVKKNHIFNLINAVLLGACALLIIYPFYNVLLISVVSQKEYMQTPFMIFPKEITFEAYHFIFHNPRFYHGYINTLMILVIGVPYNMIITTCTAYALSRSNFPGKKLITSMVIFTMYFSGGMIPLYLLIKEMGLMNNLLAVILVSGANTFYMLLIRSYFQSISPAVEESAKIDGANDIVILIRIMLPLALPIMATIILFFSVDRWNEWFNAMLFIRDGDKWPLQLVLRSIISTTTVDMSSAGITIDRNIFSDGVKMAAIFITMAPIMVLYPFLQKYFMKGIMIGSEKS